ncbi:MAG: hypothetical protein QXY18_00940, partial [Nitrososphaerota archaeon]
MMVIFSIFSTVKKELKTIYSKILMMYNKFFPSSYIFIGPITSSTTIYIPQHVKTIYVTGIAGGGGGAA